MLRVCKMCKKEFGTIHPYQFYCCKECQQKGRILQNVDADGCVHKNCAYCGKEMVLPICRQTNNRKYCSKECSRKANNSNKKKRKIANIAKNKPVEVRVEFPDWVKVTKRGVS